MLVYNLVLFILTESAFNIDFLGRTEVPVATIKKDQDGKGPLVRRLLLHEVPTGEVKVRLDLQLYEQTPIL